MEMIENGMVVGAEREYALMYADTPADKATVHDLDRFAWDTDSVKEIVVRAFGLDDDDLTEDVAEIIFTGLPAEFSARCIKDWATQDDVRERYNNYVEGK